MCVRERESHREGEKIEVERDRQDVSSISIMAFFMYKISVQFCSYYQPLSKDWLLSFD